MAYFNYHAKAKKLIMEGKLVSYSFYDEYHGIKPALVLFFEDEKPMPIRDYMWDEYLPILMKLDDEKFDAKQKHKQN